MAIEISNISPNIGSEITVDMQTLFSGSESEAIRNTLEERGVVVFRNLHLSAAKRLHLV